MTASSSTPIHLGLFEWTQPTMGGLWAHPDNQSHRLAEPEYWVELATILEDGKVDFLFFADSYGYTDVGGERPPIASTDALDLPRVDPGYMIAIASQSAKRLGFAMTGSTTFEPPFSLARRLGSLDIVTRGRFGWNVVTSGFAKSAADNFGQELTPHTERYEAAEEHVSIVYKLLEDGWEDDAIQLDREGRRYSDPAKIHRVTYEGSHFRTDGYGTTPPSVQRTPVIFQAGSSTDGRAFGAKHAEVIFLQGSTDEALKQHIDDIEQQAIASGRAPGSIRYVVGLSVVLGATTEEAKATHAEYVSYNSVEAAIAGFAQFTGIDLGRFDLDTSMADVQTELGQSQLNRHFHGGKIPTVRDIIEGHRVTMGARGLHAIGTVEEVADRMEHLVDTTGVHGFLLEPYLRPGTALDLTQKIIPELQKRGRFRTDYAEDTLRERFFGPGHKRLPDDHPAKRQA
jgi:FMN-dependent oxidoreductase (nitrilotriacetate monooxygenase family)